MTSFDDGVCVRSTAWPAPRRSAHTICGWCIGWWVILWGNINLRLGFLGVIYGSGLGRSWSRSRSLRVFVGIFIKLADGIFYALRALQVLVSNVVLKTVPSLTSKNTNAFPSSASEAKAKNSAMFSSEGNMFVKCKACRGMSKRIGEEGQDK